MGSLPCTRRATPCLRQQVSPSPHQTPRMNVCRATKRDGNPCTLPANGPSGLCWAHDPANAERRRRGQSRGGKNKPGRELEEIKREIKDLIADVLKGEVDRSTGAVALQGYNTLLRAVELGRRDDLEDLAREVEELKRGYGGAA
jgi:hypothetical protein